MHRKRADLPVIYSCSGCSSAAQTANDVALELDRMGVAEMSCIAGVGGDVPSILKLAHSGRPLAAIDGCPLMCVKNSLARHGLAPLRHWQLAEHGVRKRMRLDADQGQVRELVREIANDLRALAATTAAAAGPEILGAVTVTR